MRTVIQRVDEARVIVDSEVIGSINKGLLVLLAIGNFDLLEDVNWLARKIINLRVFPNEKNIPHYSLKDISGSILVIPQFTLYADLSQGRRPSYFEAAKPDQARRMFDELIMLLKINNNIAVQTGRFQSHMKVYSCNDGPVTFLLDSKDR
ncbi:MAG: D-aminoacyl-tRNA deacylase [Dehalococcoidia bacterium]